MSRERKKKMRKLCAESLTIKKEVHGEETGNEAAVVCALKSISPLPRVEWLHAETEWRLKGNVFSL